MRRSILRGEMEPGAKISLDQLRDHYKVLAIGQIDSVTERFYAISVERKVKHPAVVTICETARTHLFIR